MNSNIDSINKLISNKLEIKSNNFALMIGLKPSKGARSPSLWNKFFTFNNINAEMYPADLENEKKLIDLLNTLKNNKSFIGAAIAAPYKKTVYEFFRDECHDDAANASCAANNIFRNIEGVLSVANTDANAAVISIENEIFRKNSQKKAKVLILGMGATGRAIAALLKNSCELYVWNRSKNNYVIDFLENNKNTTFLEKLPQSLDKYDLLINATTLGSNQFEFTEDVLINQDLVKTSKKDLVFFDINYDPPISNHSKFFMNNGCKCINGIRMNLLQACIAISNCYEKFTPSEVEDILSKN